ncbi:MAG TPA: rhodanese-like domain-containing protein [Chitinophagaceae bacterium]|jgi:rhodanese-related sulfurtransferase|nr:rhodanese-like domain-containing protein [Chitinophagaceae bacterium]
MQKLLSLFISLLFITGIARSQNNYKEITLPELMQKASKGGKGYIILDVRTPGEYMDTITGGRHVGIGRIKSAINISIQDLEQKPEAIKQLEQYKNKDVYVICSHSYRSRRVSNLLLQNGFTSVNNVKGGMSEWYRNYDELQTYMSSLYENNISYHNLAPSQLYKKMAGNERVEIIGLKSPPRFFFDSLQGPIYDFLPDIKNTTYYKLADSLQLLEKAKKANGKPIVIFGTIGGGTNDIVAWLVQKGFSNINFLAGSLTGFYEYMLNYQSPDARKKTLISQSKIEFHTPLSFCKEQPENVQWIDLRHDTSFNQITYGTKLDYKTLKGAVNFPFYNNADQFAQQFPDKTRLYMILPQDGYTGFDLADALLKKGYRIGWLLGGIERWEWYTNNIIEFNCKDQFIKE